MFDQGSNFRQAAGFYSPSASAADDQKTDVKRPMNVVPVAISQILQAGEEHFKIGDIDVHLVTIVGVVKSLEVTSTRNTYVIEDDTGSISATVYVDTVDSSSSFVTPVSANDYVRVCGSVRNIHGKPIIMMLKIIPLEDLNELTTHLLEVIHSEVVSIQLAKKKEVDTAGNSTQLNYSTGNNTLSGYGAADSPRNGLNPKQQLIYSVIQKCEDGKGIIKSALINSVRGRIAPSEIENILDFLSNEGHVYSTIDDEHFKTTDSC